ncbi:hypothetical protein S40288_09638 [Stachybotrys chartarum IBT 40288]|nr:hypothetical protein S40288_09638 [Stachybotrys chartarum IBT 40288]
MAQCDTGVMVATPWPPAPDWPANHREHAAKLSRYLQTAVTFIDTTNGQLLEPRAVRAALMSALNFLAKLAKTPDVEHIHDAIQAAHAETKTAAENTARAIGNIKADLNKTDVLVQKTATFAEQASTNAKEAMEISKTTLSMVREVTLANQQHQTKIAQTYASVAARGGLATSIHNPQNHRTPTAQPQREIIVNIRDPVTIGNFRAMTPRALKAHIDHAIEQSGNEHIAKIKTVSTNQLKSGDLSIKTATTADMEALRQFSGDWEQRIGNGSVIRTPSYGILAHGIRTSSMNMERFEEVRDSILQDNKPFIPNAEIKYIGWLTRNSKAKTAFIALMRKTLRKPLSLKPVTSKDHTGINDLP